MRVVLDTNLLISGIFFGGLPGRILEAWRDGLVELIVSPEIFREYEQVCERLAQRHPALPYRRLLSLILSEGTMVGDDYAEEPITSDPDDDKFLLVARGADAIIASGDSDLLDADGWSRVRVLTARELLAELGLID